VATFSCMQLNRMGALVPSLHSPNTHLEALYCYPLLMRSGCRRGTASTSKALHDFAGEALFCPVRPYWASRMCRKTRCTYIEG
jgi:hypothetical protein